MSEKCMHDWDHDYNFMTKCRICKTFMMIKPDEITQLERVAAAAKAYEEAVSKFFLMRGALNKHMSDTGHSFEDDECCAECSDFYSEGGHRTTALHKLKTELLEALAEMEPK